MAIRSKNKMSSFAGAGGPLKPEIQPILVEVVEDFVCTTEGIFEDEDDCTRYQS